MIVALDVVTTTDKDGCPIVLLPLKNRTRRVAVDHQTFQELLALGVTMPLRVKDSFPSILIIRDGKRKYVRVARFITDASKADRVIYLDRDKFNLTKRNLLLFKGGSALEKDKNLITPQDTTYKIAHKHLPGGVVNSNSFNFI